MVIHIHHSTEQISLEILNDYFLLAKKNQDMVCFICPPSFYSVSMDFWTVNKSRPWRFCSAYFSKHAVLLPEFAIVNTFPIFNSKAECMRNRAFLLAELDESVIGFRL